MTNDFTNTNDYDDAGPCCLGFAFNSDHDPDCGLSVQSKRRQKAVNARARHQNHKAAVKQDPAKEALRQAQKDRLLNAKRVG